MKIKLSIAVLCLSLVVAASANAQTYYNDYTYNYNISYSNNYNNNYAGNYNNNYSANYNTVTLYSVDGRTVTVSQQAVEAYKKQGWFEEVVTMYSLDGRTTVVGDVNVEAHKKVGWYTEPVTKMYALDGRTRIEPTKNVEAYKKVGWYTEPVTKMYTLDGRTRIEPTKNVEAYKKVGWYTEPVTKMYTLDGRTRIEPTKNVEAYKKVGWYTEPVTKMYALDGRTRIEPTKNVEAYKKVGWYTEPASYALKFNCVLQNPELPTGCEVTALTSVLNYYGFKIDKVTLADNYLDKGEIGKTSPNVAFIGNPKNKSSYGCYAPVIVNCASKYLASQNSSYTIHNTTGQSLESLYSYVAKGYPVIVWGTISMLASYNSTTWNISGIGKVTWKANEHCMVLYGYDRNKKVVKIADPLKGNVEYSKNTFETRFKELGMQSIVIKP